MKARLLLREPSFTPRILLTTSSLRVTLLEVSPSSFKFFFFLRPGETEGKLAVLTEEDAVIDFSP